MKGIVYILKSKKGKFYIGSTSDLTRRLQQHRNGHTHTTTRMPNFTLAFSQEYPSLEEARKIELRLKNFKRKDIIEKIVKEGYIRVSTK